MTGTDPRPPAGDDPLEGVVVEESTEAPVVAEEPAEALGDELLADLQRVTAEYANYRKRVDRDRVAVVDMATAALLDNLLPLLDDIERARQHGDLTGGFKSVGEGLELVAEKLGLERFGAVGELFDPALHEALMAAPEDPNSSVATCAQVLQAGYRLKRGRVLRPARVAVAEPGLPVEAVEPVEPAVAAVPAPPEQ